MQRLPMPNLSLKFRAWLIFLTVAEPALPLEKQILGTYARTAAGTRGSADTRDTFIAGDEAVARGESEWGVVTGAHIHRHRAAVANG